MESKTANFPAPPINCGTLNTISCPGTRMFSPKYLLSRAEMSGGNTLDLLDSRSQLGAGTLQLGDLFSKGSDHGADGAESTALSSIRLVTLVSKGLKRTGEGTEKTVGGSTEALDDAVDKTGDSFEESVDDGTAKLDDQVALLALDKLIVALADVGNESVEEEDFVASNDGVFGLLHGRGGHGNGGQERKGDRDELHFEGWVV
ncbi:hypothetical protein BKA56DRAFT_593256 [Ilyonectria sp. MPI-CAGE-AT-0026]|nr:hypothetical protein BKA56DRAFT_593256 [Ilyonectria sp. MPI-CAGE-AT-0026]